MEARESFLLHATRWECNPGTQLGGLTSKLLAVDSRLLAKSTGKQLQLIWCGEQEVHPMDDEDECELGGDHATMTTISNPNVHPSLWVSGSGQKRTLPTDIGPLIRNVRWLFLQMMQFLNSSRIISFIESDYFRRWKINYPHLMNIVVLGFSQGSSYRLIP